MFYLNCVVEKYLDGGLFNEKLLTFIHEMRQTIMAGKKLNVASSEIAIV
jgi:hypothetical protein